MNGQLDGVGVLVRHYLRRDRMAIVWWALGIALLYWSQAPSADRLYATQAEFDTAAASEAANSALIAMTGPARALNTVGGQVAWQATAFGAILAGLMAMFLVGRHTRAEEESGRDELVRAGVVGRYAPMTAALAVVAVAGVVVGAAVSASLLSYGLAAAGSLALGLGVALSAVFFGAVALVAAQLTSTTRSMYGMVGALIGVSYVLRAIGDIGSGVLSWLSPIGWYQAMHAFSGERWWPALILLLGAVVATVGAYAVFGRRDIGSGVFAARPGPAHAGAALGSPLGLAWRLQRGSVLGWAAGLLLMGLAYGSIGNGVGDLIGNSRSTREIFSQGSSSIVTGFYATALLMMALMAAGFAVSSALRPRGEEDAGRVEGLLATGLPRGRWWRGHAAITVAGTIAVVLLGGLGLGLGFALTTGEWSAVGRYLVASISYVAPVLVLAAVAGLVYGAAPRWASLAWLGLGFCVVVMFFGPLMGFPGWLQGISPFHHVALVPAQDFRWGGFLGVLLVALLGGVAALGLFRRRDVH